jgi:hypothetical protein
VIPQTLIQKCGVNQITIALNEQNNNCTKWV